MHFVSHKHAVSTFMLSPYFSRLHVQSAGIWSFGWSNYCTACECTCQSLTFTSDFSISMPVTFPMYEGVSGAGGRSITVSPTVTTIRDGVHQNTNQSDLQSYGISQTASRRQARSGNKMTTFPCMSQLHGLMRSVLWWVAYGTISAPSKKHVLSTPRSTMRSSSKPEAFARYL